MSGAAVAVVSRKVRDKARLIAATMLEARPEDLAWEKGRWYVKGDPEKGALIEEIAARAYSGEAMPEGMEGGLDAQVIYDPPNLTYPYGAYIAVVDIDPDTGHVTVRRFIAVDDCGVRINPMVVDGQIHGGLAEGVGIALMELISFDEEGNCLNSSFMDYLIPTALECPDFELGETVTPCPHHPLGAKGVGESPNVGSPPAIVNAVIDALHQTHGVDHIDMPCTPGPGLGRDARTSRATAMMSAAVSRRAQELAAEGTVFVTATVVRAQRPTSVKAGDVALVLADGTIEGFIGGVCAQQSVRVYALKAIQSEEALLLRIVPDGPIGEDPSTGQEVPIEEGAVTARNTCLSGGTIEIFLEPVLPAPRVLVVGDTPIAGAILVTRRRARARSGRRGGRGPRAVRRRSRARRRGARTGRAAHAAPRAGGGRALHRPRGQPQARRRRARRAARRRGRQGAPRPDRRTRRPRHRRPVPRRDRAVDPRRASSPCAVGNRPRHPQRPRAPRAPPSRRPDRRWRSIRSAG